MTDMGWALRQTGWEAVPPTWTSLLLRGLEAKATSSLWLMATADVVLLPGALGPGSNPVGSKKGGGGRWGSGARKVGWSGESSEQQLSDNNKL